MYFAQTLALTNKLTNFKMFNFKNIFTQFGHLYHLLWPLNINLNFFLHYRAAVEELAINKDGPFRKQVQVLSLLIRFRAIQQLFLYFFEPDLGTEQRLAFFDYINFLQLPGEVRLIFAMLVAMSEYLFRQFYFFADGRFLCDKILFPVMYGSGSIFEYLLLPPGRRKVAVIGRALNMTKLYIYGNQLTSQCVTLWFALQLLTLYREAGKFLDCCSQSTFSTIFLLSSAHLSYTLDIAICLVLNNALQLVCVHVLLTTLVFFTRLNVLNERFSSMAYLSGNFNRLSKEHTLTLVHICQTNVLYRRVTLSIVLVFTPTNAYFLATLALTRHLSTDTLIFFSAIFIGQLGGIFGFHSILTQYSAKLHAHWRPLLRWYVRKGRKTHSFNRFTSVKDQLKVHLKIETFLVKQARQYGVSYGSVALVSIGSFAKVS